MHHWAKSQGVKRRTLKLKSVIPTEFLIIAIKGMGLAKQSFRREYQSRLRLIQILAAESVMQKTTTTAAQKRNNEVEGAKRAPPSSPSRVTRQIGKFYSSLHTARNRLTWRCLEQYSSNDLSQPLASQFLTPAPQNVQPCVVEIYGRQECCALASWQQHPKDHRQ